jgi:hypothetical protein
MGGLESVTESKEPIDRRAISQKVGKRSELGHHSNKPTGPSGMSTRGLSANQSKSGCGEQNITRTSATASEDGFKMRTSNDMVRSFLN